MKKSELIEVIRKAVRLELSESLPKIIGEVVKKIDNTNTDPVSITKKVLKREASVTSNKKPLKTLSKNPLLNQALNETIGGVPHEGNLVSGYEEANQITDFNGNTHSVSELPDHVSSALNRDYSDLIKAVNKKKGVNTLGK
jgi:DNA helicase TIP49 (TBP-interacting protein)